MRCTTALLIALLLLTPLAASSAEDVGPAPRVLIAGVHPGGASDWEHVLLVSFVDVTVDLSGWSLDDGEGTWSMPEGSAILPGQLLGVGINSSAYQLLWGTPLDITCVKTGSFCLADRGDSLVLRDTDGEVVDQLVYGATEDEPPPFWHGGPIPTPASMPWGRLLLRIGTDDTNTSADWKGWTEPRCGWRQSPPDTAPFKANASCFVTPAQGWDTLSWAIASARSDLSIALYDLTSQDLGAVIAEAAKRGVTTRLLIEGSPVGMSESETEWRTSILNALVTAGVEVWVTSPNVKGETHRPYRYHHEKYCIVDGTLSVVTTENWCKGSFPREGTDVFGSRGWGAIVESKEVAMDLTDTFEHDLELGAEPLDPPEDSGLSLGRQWAPSRNAPTMHPCNARLLVGPEGWGPDLESLRCIIGGAEESILLELAYLEVRWGDQISPLVEELLRAAAEGVEVRLVLDHGLEGEGREALEDLHGLAAQRGVIDLRGVIASNLSDATRVHTKGAVIDGRTAILGSLNWAWSSVARNREVVMVVDSENAVRVLAETFEADWNASVDGVGPSPPWGLVIEMVSRGQDRSFPHHTLEPFGRDSEGAEGFAPEGKLTWTSLVKVVLAIIVFTSTWLLERMYGFRVRASIWLGDRLGALKVRVVSPSPHPSSGEEVPDVPRTTSPVSVQEREPPREEPPRKPPPRRVPRVVPLEGEEVR